MKLLSKISLLTLMALVMQMPAAIAQCAMCRATIENNVSNGDIGIGAGLNFGILYLFVMPYILIGTVAFLWYRHSKKNTTKERKRFVRG